MTYSRPASPAATLPKADEALPHATVSSWPSSTIAVAGLTVRTLLNGLSRVWRPVIGTGRYPPWQGSLDGRRERLFGRSRLNGGSKLGKNIHEEMVTGSAREVAEPPVDRAMVVSGLTRADSDRTTEYVRRVRDQPSPCSIFRLGGS